MSIGSRLSKLERVVQKPMPENPYMSATIEELDGIILAMYSNAETGTLSQKCFAAAVERLSGAQDVNK